MTDAVIWTQHSERWWTGTGTITGYRYTATQTREYGPDVFPWLLWRSDEGIRGDVLRVTNPGWCFEYAEMWERTGIKPVRENLREIADRLHA